MSPDRRTTKPTPEERIKKTIEDSIDTLTGERYALSKFEVTIDEDVAAQIGEAISRRDSKAISEPFDPVLQSIEREYEDGDVSEVQATLDAKLAELPSQPENILAALTNQQSRLELDEAITVTNDNLGLTPTEYMRLLETILIAETPENVDLSDTFRKNPKRFRHTPYGLYARAVTALDHIATQRLGVRSLREGITNDNPAALADYFKQAAETKLAQNILGNHYDSILDETSYQKAGELRYLLGENEVQGEIEKFEILDWTILPGDEDSRDVARKSIRHAVESSSKRRDLEDWDESRVDIIFEIADLGHERGRQPEVYISNTFKSGAGVYVAVSLTHPQDPNKRIVIADNPLYSNAIYFVDELQTERDESGQQYGWQEVMVSSKSAARARGAKRRYHVGNWENFAYKICDYEGKPVAETEDETIHTPLSEPVYDFEDSETIVDDETSEASTPSATTVRQYGNAALREALARLDAQITLSREFLHQRDES